MLTSGLPDLIADDEPILRMIHESNKFGLNGAKPAAFLPPAEGELSTARHLGVPREEVMVLAAEWGLRPVIAGAVIKAGDIRRCALEIKADEPPDRHAIIVGWPVVADLDEQKSVRKEYAMMLATSSELISY